MDLDEIKVESPVYDQQCNACLSVGRKLSHLGQYTSIFMTITSNIYQSSSYGVMLCWECSTLLHNITKFQHKVWKANELLKLEQNYVCKSLSTLSTVMQVDLNSHYLCVSETDIHNEEKTDGPKEMQDGINMINMVDDFNNSFIEENDVIDESDLNIKEEEGTKVKRDKKKIKPRWAKQLIIQNKKPKFKIITNVNVDDMFDCKRIDDCEVDSSKACERDRVYKTSKWKCTTCGIGFHKQCRLLAHNKKFHTKNRMTYICDMCYKRISSKRHLAAHISTHYYKYTCSLCDYSTTKKSQTHSHYRNRHKNILYQCVQCKLKSGHRREIYKHYKNCHQQYICDYCGHVAKMKYCIEEHIRKRHSPYECKPCEKIYSRYNGLWMHNKRCHPPPPASPALPPTPPAAAYCVECDIQYANEYRYKCHLASSNRHRPRPKRRHPCPDCDKVFSKNIYMKDHQDLVHLKLYKFRCEACDKNFLRNSALLLHQKRVHEGILPPRNKICYICGRGFSTNKILQNHVRTHTGERPFACAHCDARFTQRVALQTHIRARHHTSKDKNIDKHLGGVRNSV